MLSREDAMKRALFAEILREIRTEGSMRDVIRRNLEQLPPWTPFEDVTEYLSSPTARQMGIEDPDVLRKMQEMLGVGRMNTRVYQNSRYFVHVTKLEEGWTLSIRTLQNDARHDWREFQRIKNELCGPECEAVELYPAESRLVDTANQFYVHVLPPDMLIPLGFNERLVMRPDDAVKGSNQRPWEPGQEPPDVKTPSPGVEKLLLERAMKALQGERSGEDTKSESDCIHVGASDLGDGSVRGGRSSGNDTDDRSSDGSVGQSSERGKAGEGAGADWQDHAQAEGAIGEGGRQVSGVGGSEDSQDAQEEGEAGGDGRRGRGGSSTEEEEKEEFRGSD